MITVIRLWPPSICSTPFKTAALTIHEFVTLSVLLFAVSSSLGHAEEIATFTPTLKLTAKESIDQDDMCIWVHPTDPALSTIIASDKSANRIFVYDTAGELLQTIAVAKPGNIDIRQRVVFDGRAVDIVVVNLRADGFKLAIFQVGPESRKLERIDDNCITGPNYGGCLYHSPKTGRLYFVCTSSVGSVEQYELQASGHGGVKATKVRTLSVGKCEGAVADDEAQSLYISEESKGIWKFNAEPDAHLTGQRIASVGEHGMKGDVEGLAICKHSNGTGYLLVSDQGRNRFMAFQRETPHEFIGEFMVDGAVQTDGIEVSLANLGPNFPKGLFACHTDRPTRAVLLTPWTLVASQLKPIPSAK